MRNLICNFFYGAVNGAIATAMVVSTYFFVQVGLSLLLLNDNNPDVLIAVAILYGIPVTAILSIFPGIPLGGIGGLFSFTFRTTYLAIIFGILVGGLVMVVFGIVGRGFFHDGLPIDKKTEYQNLNIMVSILGGIIGGSVGGYYFHQRLLKLTRRDLRQP
ncbi:MAG: hypothetical protein KJ063_17940 [Anaerolineae bacterium]|nr:hypothetical protein [Anaerolineae bacterium]